MQQQEKTFCKTCKTETHLYLHSRYATIQNVKNGISIIDFLDAKLRKYIIATKYYGRIFSEKEYRDVLKITYLGIHLFYCFCFGHFVVSIDVILSNFISHIARYISSSTYNSTYERKTKINSTYFLERHYKNKPENILSFLIFRIKKCTL